MRSYSFEAKALTVGYGGVPLIRDISFTVAPGEIVTLIGPNGAGKSTILKSITRQLRRIAGAVYICGTELGALSQPELARRQAVLLTERARPELMTCRDVVAAGRTPYTGRLGLLGPEDEDKIDAALEAVSATDIAGRDFNEVSDGQRQRILLARAVCQEPELLVLDEPTSFLDIRHKLDLLGILKRMAKERGIAVLMSLHETELAQKLSDKLICVRGETIFRTGTPEEIFRPEIIRELYDLDEGAYEAHFGSVELPRVEGEPSVLVLSNSGSGIPVYRRLQREGTPFVAGILSPNDIDCALARLLAVRVIETPPFEALSDAAVEEAEGWVRRCGRVIDAGMVIGSQNARVREVLALAEALGKLETW